MTIPVLTAVADAAVESQLVATVSARGSELRIVRRCVDVADLLAVASTGAARAALVSAQLRQLDREVVARLGREGVAVVLLFVPGDEAAQRRAHQLGAAAVLPQNADLGSLADAVARTIGEAQDQPLEAPEPELDEPVPAGQIVAVWGATGAPGRTTIALSLAAELALLDVPTLLVDADPYGGTVAQRVGLLDEVSGLAAAARAANSGALDVPRLSGLARDLGPGAGGLRVLTGLARADRWPELGAASVEAVLETARRLAAVTVVDCGFCLEQEDAWRFDASGLRRNAATLASIEAADRVLAVGSADPIGLVRLARGLTELSPIAAGAPPLLVLNRIRGRQRPDIADLIQQHCGLPPAALVPLDVDAVDSALDRGLVLAEAAPRSPARLEIAALASRLTGGAAEQRRGGRLRRRPSGGRHTRLQTTPTRSAAVSGSSTKARG
jgi:MinD-like ATPase involved in chromosome partitioning or flagellar assembly